jgi:hypothetical protein
MRSVVASIFFILAIAFVVRSDGQVSVTTWHNDNGRTGQNTNEVQLTTSSFSNRGFGRLCRIALLTSPQQEEVYAQPLVVANSDGSMTVYVATMQDNVYVFNVPSTTNWTSQTCTQLQSTVPISLLRGKLAGQFPADVCLIGSGSTDIGTCTRSVCPSVGILGTPVIDAGSHTMYLVTDSQDANNPGPQGINCPGKKIPNFFHYLHALDLTSPTLAEKNNGPVQITPPSIGQAVFQSQQLLQRPGLLFLGSASSTVSATVYMAFAMMDGTFPNPSGWVVAYDGGNLTQGGYPLTFATVHTQNARGRFGGGIWQGGAGLAAGVDASQNNYIYVSTADGIFDASNSDYGDSFLKLTTHLELVNSFTPGDDIYRWEKDLDFGSAGEMLVPDNTLPAPYNHLVIKGDKENYIWVMDRTNPSQVLQQLPITGTHARSTAAFWFDGTTPYIYIAQVYTQLSQYKLSASCNPAPLCSPATAVTSDPLGYAATPSVSSNGHQNNGSGIVWVLVSVSSKSPLYAFDAENLAPLYESKSCPNDSVGPPTKFSVPTVANGYVFVGTQTDFDIFGLKPGSCK